MNESKKIINCLWFKILLFVGIPFSFLIIAFSFSKQYGQVIYKKEIYETDFIYPDCQVEHKKYDINALHLLYSHHQFPVANRIEFQFNEKVIGQVFLDFSQNLLKYPKIFYKDQHIEKMIKGDDTVKIFFYPQQYPEIKNLHEFQLKFNFYKNNQSVGFKKYNVNMNQFVQNSYHWPSFHASFFRNKVSTNIHSDQNYLLLLQTKQDSDIYLETPFNCETEQCKKKFSKQFSISDKDTYAGVLLFINYKDNFTYEHKYEFFKNSLEKKCLK